MSASSSQAMASGTCCRMRRCAMPLASESYCGTRRTLPPPPPSPEEEAAATVARRIPPLRRPPSTYPSSPSRRGARTTSPSSWSTSRRIGSSGARLTITTDSYKQPIGSSRPKPDDSNSAYTNYFLFQVVRSET
uniref:Uncharacterized protein n=1 Tax=Aegilops tauschii subsp. strangulata TaxID=200361 RepID=A0A453A4K9_AEGTS